MRKFASAVVVGGVGLIAAAFVGGHVKAGGRINGVHRKVDFKLTNAEGMQRGRVHVVGVGGFPLRMSVTDKGAWRKNRELKVVVAIFATADPNGLTTSREMRVVLHEEPRILKTPAGQDGEFFLESDIPLLPGNYIVHAYICDLTRPYVKTPDSAPTLPDPEEMPGDLIEGSTFTLHVEPYL